MLPMTWREAMRRLKREGWKEVRQAGSHKQFVKNGQRITVCDKAGDMTPGAEADVKKKAGW